MAGNQPTSCLGKGIYEWATTSGGAKGNLTKLLDVLNKPSCLILSDLVNKFDTDHAAVKTWYLAPPTSPMDAWKLELGKNLWTVFNIALLLGCEFAWKHINSNVHVGPFAAVEFHPKVLSSKKAEWFCAHLADMVFYEIAPRMLKKGVPEAVIDDYRWKLQARCLLPKGVYITPYTSIPGFKGPPKGEW